MIQTKTVEEILLEVEESVYADDISTEDKAILNNIETLVNELRGRGVGGKDFRLYSADELSRISGSLALLKDSLADVLAKAHKAKNNQEAYIKLLKRNSLREKGVTELTQSMGKKPTVDDVKSYIEKRLFKVRIKLNSLEEFYMKVSNKWWSLKSLLGVISDRIHILQSQEADVKLMNDSLEVVSPQKNN